MRRRRDLEEHVMTADREKYSRYQILCAEREAWNDGESRSEEHTSELQSH